MVGVSGVPKVEPLSHPVLISIGPTTVPDAAIISVSCPLALLGHQTLCKLNASIYCSPQGLMLEILEANYSMLQAAISQAPSPPTRQTLAKPGCAHQNLPRSS
ncbi:hypothetical protein chiPu_0007389 [Chiloscyllium punctatum]|uniref:Uncharacterized protein n=1 Tax=Chiloscyllium punctatum TaxID=137246 RepID=A0A401SF20_CHIPU|nr:hypothetical protein [Chiloscyllium punctatum]